MKKQIITISRELCSGGRLVGQKLAEELGVPYYDKNILDEIAMEKGYSREMIEEDEKKAKNSFFYSLSSAFGASGYGQETLSINEKFFLAQFEFITKLVQKDEGGVIVGRCADYVLGEYSNTTNVFIYAQEETRIKRAIQKYAIPEAKAKKLLSDVDKARANYYKYHTGKKWGDTLNYHLAVDSGALSADSIVKLIMNYIDYRYEK